MCKEKELNIIVSILGVGYLWLITILLSLNYWENSAIHHDRLLDLQTSVDEIEYYVNEDSFNGNLDNEVTEFYLKEIDKLNTIIEQL